MPIIDQHHPCCSYLESTYHKSVATHLEIKIRIRYCRVYHHQKVERTLVESFTLAGSHIQSHRKENSYLQAKTAASTTRHHKQDW